LLSISSYERFAAEFNEIVPGAYRHITADDVQLMTQCGLIRRYKFYVKGDLQTVISILKYEQLREKRIDQEVKPIATERLCRACGNPLSSRDPAKKGRPKEYCSNCDPLRSKLRNRKWRNKKLTGLN
jgi:hypothetical protein